VLARNVFLFTYLAAELYKDGTESAARLIWELYYHIFISSSARGTLTCHVTHLLDSSRSSEVWNKSSYGIAFKFYSEKTLHEIRQYWQLYLDACNDGRDREIRDAVQDMVEQRGLDDGRIFHSSTRATGVHALKSATIMSAAFRAYWSTGVVAGNSEDSSALEQDDGGHANPLLYISSAPLGRFAVHYGTDPLHCFHLAQVFDTPGEEKDMLQRLAIAAKTQFQGWCETFTEHIRMGAFRMFFHCGEAVSLCYELQLQSSEASRNDAVPAYLHTYSRPWSTVCLDLSLGKSLSASSSFDVIDTSNISDHIGILNLIPAVRPLLNDSALSVLYTETLLRAAVETTAYLDELLRLDVGSVGLIAGIIPTASVLGIFTDDFGSESFSGHYGRNTGSQSQLRVRLSWKRPSGGDLLKALSTTRMISADADDLASLLFRWYLNMFSAFEDVSLQLSVHLRRAITPLSQDLRHYTRTTLVALIGLAYKQIQTDWPKCIELLLDKIQTDRALIVGSNSWQELYMLLHLVGIYQISALEMPPKAAAASFSATANCYNMDPLSRWPDMPSVVAVALVVPRQALHVFTSADLNRIGTPGLHLAVYNEKIFDNSFHAIHTCFGKLVIGNDSHTSTIDEDALGWRGHSELIVTCLVTAFQFLLGSKDETRVALVINSSSANTYFIPILGPHLRVFDTSIENRHNFHVLQDLPGIRSTQTTPVLPPRSGCRSRESLVSTTVRDGRVQLLTLRQEVLNTGERNHLQNGYEVHTNQESPCALTI